MYIHPIKHLKYIWVRVDDKYICTLDMGKACLDINVFSDKIQYGSGDTQRWEVKAPIS